MKRKPQKRRNWRSLTLITIGLLTGCDFGTPTSSTQVTYCPEAIHPIQETKDWLKAAAGCSPPSAATTHYLYQIANQQALFDRGCR